MDYYRLSFIGLVALNTFLATKQFRTRPSPLKRPPPPPLRKTKHPAILAFEWNFYLVYLFAVAVDWIQGPHIYTLYKYEMNLPERTVTALYASGFISGAVSASFVGSLADRHGCRAACLMYCASYSLCCLSTLSSSLPVLILGRALGGVSTTLLFSMFETWMISDYHARGAEIGGLDLVSVFGCMTTPFLAGICHFAIAAILLLRRWDEN